MKKYGFDYLKVFHTCLLLASFVPGLLLIIVMWPDLDFSKISDTWLKFGLTLCLYFVVAFFAAKTRKDAIVIDDYQISITIKNETKTILLSDITHATFFPGRYSRQRYAPRHLKRLSCLTLFNNNIELVKIDGASILVLIDLVKRTGMKYKLVQMTHYIFLTVMVISFIILLWFLLLVLH
jgi:hypothetical protein